jgi:uncharacterized protein (DUF1778 family)
MVSHVFPWLVGGNDERGPVTDLSDHLRGNQREAGPIHREPRPQDFVVEQALLFFMEARRELPDEALVPARIVLEDENFDRVVAMLTEPPAPTEDLRELMRGRGN